MKGVVFAIILFFQNGFCTLWPNGVVHFAINSKDYDIHSQDVIMSTLSDIEKEICVKFFSMPTNFNITSRTRVLYINNPEKRKNCPPERYNFSASVIDMPIGYKCLNAKNIARIVVDMLKSSIEQTVTEINSFDLIKKFQEMDTDHTPSFLISPADRNFINAHYHSECSALTRKTPIETRRVFGAATLSEENRKFYEFKLWPLGVVMYGINATLRYTDAHRKLKHAMTTIELGSCIIFQEVRPDDVLIPKNMVWFDVDGAELPALGFQEGKQIISLKSMIEGAPGHTAHTLNMLMRIMGIAMMSNRVDRDNYVTVSWSNVEKGKEHYLEKSPKSAWIMHDSLPYDFDSVTHAPANFMCRNCNTGCATVLPTEDHLWQRQMSMGHCTTLSETDVFLLDLLYKDRCRDRITTRI